MLTSRSPFGSPHSDHVTSNSHFLRFEDENDKIAAVLLLRVIHRDDFGRVFSRTMLDQGTAQQKCTALKNALNRKADIFADMDCETFLRLYLLCVKPEYRRKGKRNGRSASIKWCWWKRNVFWILLSNGQVRWQKSTSNVNIFCCILLGLVLILFGLISNILHMLIHLISLYSFILLTCVIYNQLFVS